MRLFQDTFVQHKPGRPMLSALVVFTCGLNSAGLWAAVSAGYVQGAYSTPQSPQTTVAVKFTAAQATGDLNVVVAGWNDGTATVNSVTDSSGNTYILAVGPTVISGLASQSIYYAANIAGAAAGANTVTVQFSTAAVAADIRILEYSGVATVSPVDVTAANSGNSSSSSSGSGTTTNANDLIFGANLVLSLTSGPGSGFTSRLLTVPDGDIAEDQVVAATGNYSATAPISPGNWIMQMVAFKAAGAISACDLNADGAVDILDVQLATDMMVAPSPPPCLAPGGYCTAIYVSNVLNAALGQSCVLPALGSAPSTINFGNVVVGNTGVQTGNLTVAGTGSTTISQVTVTPATYSISGLTLPLTLAVSQNAPFNVMFTPTATGSVSGSITIVSSALDKSYTLPLSGAGVTSPPPHSVSLTWTASTSSNVASYNVYRLTSSSSTAPATPYPVLVSNLAASTTCSGTTKVCSYTDSTVSAGTSYWYYAAAVDTSNNVSGPSNTAQAIVPSP